MTPTTGASTPDGSDDAIWTHAVVAVENESSELLSLCDIRDNDVLLGRGKSNLKHPGNVRFQAIIGQTRDRYFAATKNQDKQAITESVRLEIDGRFLCMNKVNQRWVVISDKKARVKIAQALQYRHRRSQQRPLPSIGRQRIIKNATTVSGFSILDNFNPNSSCNGMHAPQETHQFLSNAATTSLHGEDVWYGQQSLDSSRQHQLKAEQEDTRFTIEEMKWVLGVSTELSQDSATTQYGCQTLEAGDDTTIGLSPADFINRFHYTQQPIGPQDRVILPLPDQPYFGAPCNARPISECSAPNVDQLPYACGSTGKVKHGAF